jgi:hypothetical protein
MPNGSRRQNNTRHANNRRNRNSAPVVLAEAVNEIATDQQGEIDTLKDQLRDYKLLLIKRKKENMKLESECKKFKDGTTFIPTGQVLDSVASDYLINLTECMNSLEKNGIIEVKRSDKQTIKSRGANLCIQGDDESSRIIMDIDMLRESSFAKRVRQLGSEVGGVPWADRLMELFDDLKKKNKELEKSLAESQGDAFGALKIAKKEVEENIKLKDTIKMLNAKIELLESCDHIQF